VLVNDLLRGVLDALGVILHDKFEGCGSWGNRDSPLLLGLPDVLKQRKGDFVKGRVLLVS